MQKIRKQPAREIASLRLRKAKPEASEEIYFGVGRCSLGVALVASSDKGVVAILLREEVGQALDELQQRFPKAHLAAGDRESAEMVARVVEFIENPLRDIDLPLDVRGTAFQRQVWRAVRDIPAGETSNYSEIAEKIGSPKAVRAVGSACSNNNIALAIPCHRILHKDGSLSGGEHWGTGRQGVLIKREAEALEAGRSKKAKKGK